MSTTKVARVVDAPIGIVFSTIADSSLYSEAVPHIVKVEPLSEQRVGAGSRFRETRVMNGREASTELEVTEFVLNERIRFISDSGGTIWDSMFSFSEENGQTTITLEMIAKPYKLLARLVTPLIKGVVGKAVAADMDAIKEYCETQD